MSERIYLLGDGTIEPLTEGGFESESVLQEFVAEHPELLAGEQITPGDPRRWLLVRREMSIGDSEESGGRWSVDHLFIDQDAVPTLVEVKRSSDSRIRREVVGQMLDYAANATRYWPIESIRAEFEARAAAAGNDPGAELQLFLGSELSNSEAFWDDVRQNLRAGRVRLLFVADLIPDELQRVVEFLNWQMEDVEVLAVELKQFRGEGLRTLVPRVFGRTAKAPPPGRRISRADLLAGFAEHGVREEAAQLLDVAAARGAVFEYGSTGVSIRSNCRLWPQPVTVAWLFPATSGWMRTRWFSFGSGLVGADLPDELRAVIDGYLAEFHSDGDALDASSSGVEALAFEPDAAARKIGVLTTRLSDVLARLSEL